MLGFKGPSKSLIKTDSLFDNNKFAALKERVVKQRTWVEMKFQDQTPTCRTFHAQASYNERLIIYGGTDINKDDANPSELWVMEPLLQRKPVWHKI